MLLKIDLGFKSQHMYECFGSEKYKMSEEMWCGCYGLYVINTCEMFHVHVLAVMSPVQQTYCVLCTIYLHEIDY